ncbi:uncharacterized protein BDZ99DRAFT_535843 [Mytilinidion resinicola]|uniref:Carbohydrate kinase PfkB domain-containing protein n=1 Tax=Mytilinidion resinicola TaxID=574789 RepID=A0A6A6YGP5_9PEZI|nr:uncharacterized protein BDZ99DRAFT_535843 [Mytilinidion resinicola]KAF2807971.1 hypothetical protein BDZ99DRAFT_535843 [Mytilinidion resinicola]
MYSLPKATRQRGLPLRRSWPLSTVRCYVRPSSSFLRISDEVQEALHSKKSVVALETTIYTHGFPYPDNVALASHLESVVRTNGGVPATIGILDGIACVGMDPEELIQLTSSAGHENTLKLSRRDLGFACGMRLAGKKFNGGTTIAGTMILAHLAGIKIFGTGGLGGVHRGAESSMDISADLTELGRTPVTVISSGCKSFLDILRTLEYLETEGVGIGTFADGRQGNVDFPAFWSRDSGVKSPTTIQNELEAAAIIHAQHSLGISSGLLFANPVPESAAIPKHEMDIIIKEAIRQADAAGITGKDNTPFILNKVKELTGGKSLPANRALIESNVRRATIVARELAILEKTQADAIGGNSKHFMPSFQTPQPQNPPIKAVMHQPPESVTTKPSQIQGGIIVAGSLAMDISCDYSPLPGASSESAMAPQSHTSNPAVVTQSIGGVGYNVARAAELMGSPVTLCSVLGNDFTGRAIAAKLDSDKSPNFVLSSIKSQDHNTAQYVAVNDINKDLVVAMADMSIMETFAPDDIQQLQQSIMKTQPNCLVVDGNWSIPTLHSWLRAGKSAGVFIAFEPVSTAKATRLFPPPSSKSPTSPIFPNHLVDLASPNSHELAALHATAARLDLLSHPDWWRVIDALGIPSSGLRVPLALTTTSALVDEGIPQQSIQLLPFIPTILTKLGPRGVLLTKLLKAGDPRLSSPSAAPYVLARCSNGDTEVGGVYVRLFEPDEVVGPKEVVSVNGVGDTFLGALLSGMVKGRRVEDVVPIAQRAAGLSLKSKESVSPELVGLGEEIEAWGVESGEDDGGWMD